MCSIHFLTFCDLCSLGLWPLTQNGPACSYLLTFSKCPGNLIWFDFIVDMWQAHRNKEFWRATFGHLSLPVNLVQPQLGRSSVSSSVSLSQAKLRGGLVIGDEILGLSWHVGFIILHIASYCWWKNPETIQDAPNVGFSHYQHLLEHPKWCRIFSINRIASYYFIHFISIILR